MLGFGRVVVAVFVWGWYGGVLVWLLLLLSLVGTGVDGLFLCLVVLIVLSLI